MTPVLDVRGLRVRFRGAAAPAVKDLSFAVAPGEVLAIVGESGSGKSVTALSLMRLIDREGGRIEAGELWFDAPGANGAPGERVDLAALPEARLRRLRGEAMAMIFQEPMTSLNPVMTVGDQVIEAVQAHRPVAAKAARARALELLRTVRLSEPEARLDQHPHELSGGMRQRVMIAMAMAGRPRLLIADEPTTALDVTVQAEILALIEDLRAETGAAVIFITHDMGVVAQIADRVLVMRRGEPVETSETRRLFAQPAAAYTQDLIAAAPRLGSGAPAPQDRPQALLEVRDLVARFPLARGLFGGARREVRAVDRVGFRLDRSETLGLVGESGSGKSTIGRAVLRLVEPTSGSIRFDGREIARADAAAMAPLRRDMQMIFQDPYASLNPRLTVVRSITEPLAIHTDMSLSDRRDVAADLLRRVGLSADHLDRYPHQFSGGQRQRLCIARALSVRPRLIVADEPVSALDVSVQAQVMDLLLDLQAEHGIAMLFISHDMAVVEKMSHRIAVLDRGRIVESGPTTSVLADPGHEHTRRLIAAAPIPDPTLERPRLPVGREPASPIFDIGAPVPPQAFAERGAEHWVATA
ncbi:MAG: ABC transporter ATP-binding protein [Pseudomonadota bacterium]